MNTGSSTEVFESMINSKKLKTFAVRLTFKPVVLLVLLRISDELYIFFLFVNNYV